MNKIKKVPTLRFSEFLDEWDIKKVSQFLKPFVNQVEVNKDELYQQIGIRSHGKGIFHKDLVSGYDLGEKRVFWIKKNMFVVNIVFAWEQAIAKTTIEEEGMIASHRFPMYESKDNLCNIDYLLYFFLTDKGKNLLEIASPGGAGRNKTLGKAEFNKLKVIIPILEEQQKIANFLLQIDNRIEKLTKKKQLLEKYKKGVMQKIFNQEIRFKDYNGEDYPEWGIKKIGEIAIRSSGISKSNYVDDNGTNVIVDMGAISRDCKLLENKKTNNNDNLLSTNDLVMAKDDIGGGKIIGKVVMIPENNKYICGDHVYKITVKNGYIKFLYYAINSYEINKSFRTKANGTAQIGINNKVVDEQKIPFPCIEEQTKIANFLTEIDKKINLTEKQLNGTKQYKKGLLQQMFI